MTSSVPNGCRGLKERLRLRRFLMEFKSTVQNVQWLTRTKQSIGWIMDFDSIVLRTPMLSLDITPLSNLNVLRP